MTKTLKSLPASGRGAKHRQAGSVGANKSPLVPLYKRGKGRGILKAMLSCLSGDRKHCPTKQIPIVVSPVCRQPRPFDTKSITSILY